MIDDREIQIHPTTNELYGIHEFVVDTKDQLIALCAIIDEKRVTTATGMNQTSSRSHFMIELKMYEKLGDKLHVNSFKCMDMAGSERVIKSGVDPNSLEGWQCNYVNYSITQFARILFNLKR